MEEELSYPARSGRGWYLPGDSARAADLPAAFAAGDFVVGAAGFGAGAAPGSARALRAAGVAAVVAQSFAPAFFAEALAAGLPALAIEEAAAIKSGDWLRVDIEIFRVANRNSGDRYIVKNLDESALQSLRAAANEE